MIFLDITVNIINVIELLLLIFTVCLLIKILFFTKERPRGRIAFSMFLASTIAWMSSIYLAHSPKLLEADFLAFVAKLSWSWVVFILSSLFNFYVLAFNARIRYKYFAVTFFILSLILGALTLFTDFTITGVDSSQSRVLFGPGYYISILLVIFITSLIVAVKKNVYPKLSPRDKIRLNFLVFGSQSTVALGLLSNILVPIIIKSSKFSHLGIISIIPTIIVGYYILAVNVFHDLNSVKRNIARFLICNAITIFVYYTVTFVFDIKTSSNLGLESVFAFEVVFITSFVILYKLIFNKSIQKSHQGFYRYTLNHADQKDLLRIKKLLEIFEIHIRSVYKVEKFHLSVSLKDLDKLREIGEDLEDFVPIFVQESLVNSNPDNLIKFKLFSKEDKLDLNVFEVENLQKDLNELCHLVYQSVLHEASLNFNTVLQSKVEFATHQLKYQNTQLQNLSLISQELTATLDIDEICQRTVNFVSVDLGFTGACISFLDERDVLHIKAFTENEYFSNAVNFLGKDKLPSIDINDPQYKKHPAVRAIKTKKITVTDDYTEFSPPLSLEAAKELRFILNAEVAVYLPIITEEKTIGVLYFFINTEERLSEETYAFFNTFVRIVNIALNNAFLFDSKRKALDDLKELTVKLSKSKEELQEKYQFEKDMMGIIGHELRTPMTVAKGMVELVITKADKEDISPDYVKEKMKKVYANIIKETDLIQTMLSSSHLDNNRLNLRPSLVNIEENSKSIINLHRKEARHKGIKFIYQKPDFEFPLIMLDETRCGEIVNNLLSNAVKYTGKGGVIKVYYTKSDENIILNVDDTGIGIPEEEIRNLGQKFYRINQHLDEDKQIVRSGGTGLGLYIVKGLLEAFGGELRVTSTLNKGSTFSAVFPIISKYHNLTPYVAEQDNESQDMFHSIGLKR